MAVSELQARHTHFNSLVISNLRPSEWSHDVWSETEKDVAFGAMRGLWQLRDIDLSRTLVSRRMPVREERASGWKTRIVDDCSQSSVSVPRKQLRS